MIRYSPVPVFSAAALHRRQWLQAGGLSLSGALLPASVPVTDVSAAGASAASAIGRDFPGFGKAKSVILIYASGGQSQLETWDPKPDAPQEVRGEFAAIQSAVPGILLGEHLPRLARLADRYSIIRSVSHDDLDHGSATYLALTGHFHPIKTSNPPPRPTDLPTYGAVLKRLRPNGHFPFDAVHINGPALVPETPAPGQDGGFLGAPFSPLVLGDVNRSTVAIPSLTQQTGLGDLRLDARRELRTQLEQVLHDDSTFDPAARLQPVPYVDMDQAYQQAFHLLKSPRYRRAFDLDAEPAILRERYGRHRPGQACLLARRLVEAGVPLITVMWTHTNRGQDRAPNVTDAYGWDTHNDIFEALKLHLLPRFDQGFSALLEDLDQRGLLDQTLVICMGEFGRAPLVALEKRFKGNSPGRKHWASVYSIVMAGAGITPGGTYGASDKLAAQPIVDRVAPADISATLFAALGIDPTGHYQDPLGRPFPISEGRPITGLYR